MMMDIFSSFDPGISNINSNLFWIPMILIPFILNLTLWILPTRMFWLSYSPINLIFLQLSRTSSIHLKGLSSLVSPLFIFMILINFMGLIPYMFSASSHLLFTLSLALPLWLSLIISAIFHSPSSFMASLLPSGAPTWLNPFLVLIETISISVRPLTLAFRLAANMSAGHIVLSLVGLYSTTALFTSPSSFILLMAIQTGYFMFEVAICSIQAYIFCLLISMYADDHPV
uniref:ATP synthase subunit a n=1 Tax=Paraescarpia echinospica TaxID=2080241 RepID=A0A343TEY5_9ANNE|nr:ATP synthase F0 subunit 6 [Paraescarpia echinospica]AUW55460.1 ATP synthase F0 subunit 6 [Paraescarpia echinospica]